MIEQYVGSLLILVFLVLTTIHTDTSGTRIDSESVLYQLWFRRLQTAPTRQESTPTLAPKPSLINPTTQIISQKQQAISSTRAKQFNLSETQRDLYEDDAWEEVSVNLTNSNSSADLNVTLSDSEITSNKSQDLSTECIYENDTLSTNGNSTANTTEWRGSSVSQTLDELDYPMVGNETNVLDDIDQNDINVTNSSQQPCLRSDFQAENDSTYDTQTNVTAIIGTNVTNTTLNDTLTYFKDTTTIRDTPSTNKTTTFSDTSNDTVVQTDSTSVTSDMKETIYNDPRNTTETISMNSTTDSPHITEITRRNGKKIPEEKGGPVSLSTDPTTSTSTAQSFRRTAQFRIWMSPYKTTRPSTEKTTPNPLGALSKPIKSTRAQNKNPSTTFESKTNLTPDSTTLHSTLSAVDSENRVSSSTPRTKDSGYRERTNEYDPLSSRGGPFLGKPNAYDFLMMGQIATAKKTESQREFKEGNLEASAMICGLLNKQFCRLSIGGRCC